MNFAFTEEQQLLADSVRGFALAHLAKDALARAHEPRFPVRGGAADERAGPHGHHYP